MKQVSILIFILFLFCCSKNSINYTDDLSGKTVTLISPDNGATNIPTSNGTELLWHSLLGAFSYQIEVSKVGDFASKDSYSSNTDTSITISLEHNTLYYWKVNGWNMNESNWSQVWSFTTSDE